MTAPVIVIGMHRSGTSLVTRLLARLGLFVGWELEPNGEAVFFVWRNEAILAAQGARWDDPGAVDALLADPAWREPLARALRRELCSAGALSYLGPLRFLRRRSLLDLDFAWGWKDPRNTILLPLWLDVFPGARVVHVVRNGVDVARSLAARERARRDHVLDAERRWRDASLLYARPEGATLLSWLWSKLHLLLDRPGYRRRLERWRLHPSIELEAGFELWAEHLRRAEQASQRVEGGMLEVRYEDLWSEPEAQIRRLADHCRLTPTGARIESARALLGGPPGSTRPEEAPGSPALRDAVRTSPWMRRWGYDHP